MTRAAPLLAAKLLPPTIDSLHLRRPRLMDRLRAGLERRATLVVAGPGYGKTALVARFLKESGDDSVWYALDPLDRDPSVFFRYLVRGIKEHALEFGERSQAFWEALRFRPEEAEHLVNVFIGDAEESLGGRIVLVLDGMQHLERADSCTRALRRLLAYLPGAMHLVLVGRSLPEIGLKPLLAEGTVTQIDGEDLLFTPGETRALLRDTFGLPVRPESVERLHARTRGWVTALQLWRQTAQLGVGTDDHLQDPPLWPVEARIDGRLEASRRGFMVCQSVLWKTTTRWLDLPTLSGWVGSLPMMISENLLIMVSRVEMTSRST